MKVEFIFLILQGTFAISSLVLAKLVYYGTDLGQLFFGIAMALSILSLVQLGAYLQRKGKKLSDKDREKTVGLIERKAEERTRARAKAGYMTLKLGAYLLSLIGLSLFFSGHRGENLILILKVLLAGLAIFIFFYIFYRLKNKD